MAKCHSGTSRRRPARIPFENAKLPHTLCFFRPGESDLFDSHNRVADANSPLVCSICFQGLMDFLLCFPKRARRRVLELEELHRPHREEQKRLTQEFLKRQQARRVLRAASNLVVPCF